MLITAVGGMFEVYFLLCYTGSHLVSNKEFTAMRCLSCDAELTDFEATRKSADSNEFIDLCNYCYGFVKTDLRAVERMDLMHENDEEIFILEPDFLKDS